MRFPAEGQDIQFRVLGCAGAKTPGRNLTSFLINEALLVEGGSAASGLDIEEQAGLAGVVVSHAHLDHIGEIPYVADNIFGLREDSLKIIGAPDVLCQMRASIFNNAIWPDFCAIRHREKPILDFVPIRENETLACGDVRMTAHRVAHQETTFGFIFQDAGCALLYTSDTGPTEAIWKRGLEAEGLRAIITEVSFPNRMEELARLTGHMTPAMLRAEMRKMPSEIPVYIYHVKARHHEETTRELEALGDPRVCLLEQGETYFL